MRFAAIWATLAQNLAARIGNKGVVHRIWATLAQNGSLAIPLMFSNGPADHEGSMEVDLVELELMLNRFKRLLAEVMRGAVARNSFQPWEIEILMDLEHCRLDRRRRLEILRQYLKAVERQMATGPGPPMKLSEFLLERDRRRARMAGAAEGSEEPVERFAGSRRD